MNLDLAKYEHIAIPKGTISIGYSGKDLSTGFLTLAAGQKLPVHSRPVEEWLVQVDGTSRILLYENKKVVKEVLLKRGDMIKIPANQFHQHSNPDDLDSLTSWRFDGDITGIMAEIRRMAK